MVTRFEPAGSSMLHLIQTALLIVFPALVIVAAMRDAVSFTIPNWISIALAAATVLGAWMAVAYGREKKLSWILLAVGTVIPAVLIALSA